MKRGTIIMIAGWAHSSSDLLPLASLLPDSYNIIMTSTSELLASVKKNKRRNIANISCYAMGIQQLITECIKPCYIVASSMGAMVSIETVSTSTLNPNSMVCISASPKFCKSNDYSMGIHIKNIRAMKLGLSRKPAEVLNAFFKDCLSPYPYSNDSIKTKVEKTLFLDTNILSHGLEYLKNTDLRHKLENIKIPTLIIHGKKDMIIPWQAGAFLNENIHESKLVLHENHGHNIAIDKPEIISDDICKFLENTI